MLDKLFSERTKGKLKIIMHLESRATFSESVTCIKEHLGLTAYTLRQLVEEINNDFATLCDDKSIKLVLSKESVSLTPNVKITSSYLEEMYLKKSLEFMLLKSVFFNEFKSIKYYSETTFVSRTTTYKLLGKVTAQLKEYDIYLDRNYQLIGDEMTIRQFFVMIFCKVFKENMSIYSLTIQGEISLFKNLFSFNNKGYFDESRSNHYLGITLYRLTHCDKNTLQKHYYPLNKPNIQEEKMLMRWIEKHVLVSSYAAFEVTGILGNTSLIDSIPNLRIIERCAELVTQFFDCLKRELPQFTPELEMKTEVETLLFDYYYIRIFDDIVCRVINVQYFREKYLSVFSSCLEYIIQVNETSDVFRYNQNALFLNLLLTMLARIPLEEYEAPVYICVNFTHGDNYNKFIQKNIHTFRSFRFVFHPKVRPDTDLILSDYYLSDEMMDKTILWLAPPRASDWGYFGERVLEISYQKQNKENFRK